MMQLQMGTRMIRNPFAIVASCIVILAIAEAWSAIPNQRALNSFSGKHASSTQYNNIDEDVCVEPQKDNLSRRRFFQKGMVATTFFSVTDPGFARAAIAQTEQQTEEKEGLMTASAVADLLRPVPTFTIVDEKGIPFTVVGEDAKVTGYFFTTYKEAQRILELAKSSADRAIAKAKADKTDEDIGTNPWKRARISTVPLDYAVTVVTKSMRMSGKGVYFKMAPADDDIEDALTVTGDDDLAEGKVPLFYYEDFKVADGEGKEKTPLYFRKDELEKEWRRLNPGKEAPKINVTELLSLIAELLRPGGSDEELKNLAFVLPKESESKRKECLKKGGKEPAFVVGKRIIVL